MSTKLLAIVRDQRKSAEAEIEVLNKEREVRQAEADRLMADAEKEDRDLNSKEAARFREVTASIREIDARLDRDSDDAEERGLKQKLAGLLERETELRSHLEAKEKSAKAQDEWASRDVATEYVAGNVRVKSEPRTYSRESENRGQSFFADLYQMRFNGDPGATQRLERHSREARLNELAGYERRDVGTAQFAGLTVPQYLTDMVAPGVRAMAPTVAICNRHPLPANGTSVNISRITTKSAVAAQSTDHVGVQETDMDDTLLTVNVKTYAGMQDVSRQALDRGTGIDGILVADLTADYWTKLDDAILNADGTLGTHTSIRSTSSIETVTFTDNTSPTVAELYPKLAQLISQIQSGVFMGVSHFIMHPRRFWWIASEVGANRPLLHVSGVATEQAGNIGSTDYMANDKNILGVPVVLDGNIPTNLTTNLDIILGVTARELHLWHDDGPLFIRAEQPLANQLGVRFVAYSYSAFTAGRYPGAHGTISGTGLTAPSFGTIS